MIKGIIFDCFGVLYGGSFSALTSMCPPDKHEQLHDYNRQVDYGYITTDEYAEAIGKLLSITKREVYDLFTTKHVRNQELVEYLKELKKSYSIGLLSNVGTETMDGLFSPDERTKLFDAVVLSYKEGVAKPNPAAFQLMAERMSLSPGECVMIDDLEENCDAAEVVGMQSIQHITNRGTREKLEKILLQKGA
jgi:putative hydrolase of the HAD superfamily